MKHTVITAPTYRSAPRFFPADFKRELCAICEANPTESKAAIAKAHDVTPKSLYSWLRDERFNVALAESTHGVQPGKTERPLNVPPTGDYVFSTYELSETLVKAFPGDFKTAVWAYHQLTGTTISEAITHCGADLFHV